MKIASGITSGCLICIALSWGVPSTAQDNVSSLGDITQAAGLESADSVGDDPSAVQRSPLSIRVVSDGSDTTNPDTLQIVPVTADTIQRAVDSGEYVLFYRANLHRLSSNGQVRTGIELPSVTAAAAARYSAVLTDNSLIRGTLHLQLNASKDVNSRVLGQTNLSELEFQVDGRPVASAALSDGRLSLLPDGEITELEATWSARGVRNSDGILFELQLPPATVTELQVETAADIHITSPNAVVWSESNAGRLTWFLSPRSSHTVTFLCQPVSTAADSYEMSAVAVDTTLTVAGKTIFAEWTFVVPPELDDSSATVTFSGNCHITDVASQSGRRHIWRLSGESSRQLIVSGLRAGGTVVIHGSSDAEHHGGLVLPLLTKAQQQLSEDTGPVLPLRSTGLRLVVTRGLAVRRLDLEGLYQQDVSFNSAGEQVIELRQLDVDASGAIHVLPSTAPLRQKLLIHRHPETPELVTVYAELEPCSDNDDVYKAEWDISGPWRPVSVDDIRTNLPVYLRVRPSDDRTSDQLQIEFRSAATSFQPAWLRIEFRSTQAVTPLKSSLPVLVNDEYPTVGNWILDSDAVPFATNGPMKVVTDIAAELQNEFAWTMLDISEPEELQMTKTDRLLPVSADPVVSQTVIQDAVLNYELQLTEIQLIENLQIRLDPTEQLPGAVVLVFPKGIDLKSDGPATTGILSKTGRLTNDQWQEWLLSFPATRTDDSVHTFNLRAVRPLASAEFAAIPRLPNDSGVSLTVRSSTATAGEFANIALVTGEPDSSDFESLVLQPGNPVMVPKFGSQFRIRFSRTSDKKPFLGVRGTAWFAASPEPDGEKCECFADLVVSRTGSVEAEYMAVKWAEATDIRIYIDNQPVIYPVKESVTRILLPKNQTTTGVRILWTSPLTETGRVIRSGTITLPTFESDVNVDLAHIVQLPPDVYASSLSTSGISDGSNLGVHDWCQIVTENTPVRDFMMRWRLAEQSGAARTFCSTENGQIHVSMVSRRSTYCGAILVFWCVVIGSRFFARLRLRTVAVLMVTGTVLSVFAGPLGSSLLFGSNFGLAVCLLIRKCWQPANNPGNQVLPEGDRHRAVVSIPSAASAAIALLLTGQTPLPADLPPVLVNEEVQTTLPFVYVRRNILPAVEGVVEADVRVLGVEAHVRVEQEGGAEITVNATVASPLTGHASTFSLPTASATLTDCSLDDVQVSPSRGPRGNPQLVIPVQSDVNESTTAENGWYRHTIKYTLRTNVRPAPGHYNIRVPLPFSVRSQVTLETIDDQVLTAGLVEPYGMLAVPEASGLVEFPPQYNRGSLDISIETRNSQSKSSEVACLATVICRAELSYSETKLICRYQLTSRQQLPTELILSPVPGYEPVDVLSREGVPLQLARIDGRQVVQGSPDQLADFHVSWEAKNAEMTVDRLIPAAALHAPERCSVRRILIGVEASNPLEVEAVAISGQKLIESHPGEEERKSLELTRTDEVYEIGSIPDDIHLKLRMRTTRQTAQLTSRITADVDEISWSCHCDIQTTGPEIFRQCIQVQS